MGRHSAIKLIDASHESTVRFESKSQVEEYIRALNLSIETLMKRFNFQSFIEIQSMEEDAEVSFDIEELLRNYNGLMLKNVKFFLEDVKVTFESNKDFLLENNMADIVTRTYNQYINDILRAKNIIKAQTAKHAKVLLDFVGKGALSFFASYILLNEEKTIQLETAIKRLRAPSNNIIKRKLERKDSKVFTRYMHIKNNLDAYKYVIEVNGQRGSIEKEKLDSLLATVAKKEDELVASFKTYFAAGKLKAEISRIDTHEGHFNKFFLLASSNDVKDFIAKIHEMYCEKDSSGNFVTMSLTGASSRDIRYARDMELTRTKIIIPIFALNHKVFSDREKALFFDAVKLAKKHCEELREFCCKDYADNLRREVDFSGGLEELSSLLVVVGNLDYGIESFLKVADNLSNVASIAGVTSDTRIDELSFDKLQIYLSKLERLEFVLESFTKYYKKDFSEKLLLESSALKSEVVNLSVQVFSRIYEIRQERLRYERDSQEQAARHEALARREILAEQIGGMLPMREHTSSIIESDPTNVDSDPTNIDTNRATNTRYRNSSS